MRLRRLSCTLSFGVFGILAFGRAPRARTERAPTVPCRRRVAAARRGRPGQQAAARARADRRGLHRTRQRGRDADSRLHADRAGAAAAERGRLGRRRGPRRRHQSSRRRGRTPGRHPDGSDDSHRPADSRPEDCHDRGRVSGPSRSGRRRFHEQQRRSEPRRAEPDSGPRPAAGGHQRGRSEHGHVCNGRGDHEPAVEPIQSRPAERFPLPVRTLRARNDHARGRGRARARRGGQSCSSSSAAA